MKTLLNLLPEEKKERIQQGLRSRFILWQIFLLLFLELFYLGALVGVFFILRYQYQSLQALQGDPNAVGAEETETLQKYEEKFKGTNEAVDTIGKFARTHLYFSNVFLLLDRVVPQGIVMQGLSTKDYRVTLLGRAATRDDLLAFEGRLKGEACVTGVDIPLSNLFSEKDIDFQVDFDLKPECLHNPDL